MRIAPRESRVAATGSVVRRLLLTLRRLFKTRAWRPRKPMPDRADDGATGQVELTPDAEIPNYQAQS